MRHATLGQISFVVVISTLGVAWILSRCQSAPPVPTRPVDLASGGGEALTPNRNGQGDSPSMARSAAESSPVTASDSGSHFSGEVAVDLAAERFGDLTKKFIGLVPAPVVRRLTDDEGSFVLDQAQMALDAIVQKERDLGLLVDTDAIRNTEAFLLEKRAVTYWQFEAIEHGWYVIGPAGYHTSFVRQAYANLHDQWYNLGCRLPDGSDVILLLPFWEGTTLRSAFEDAARLRRAR